MSDNKDKSTDNQTEAKGAGVSSANQGKNQDQVQPDASVIECLLSKKRNATKRKVYVMLTPILCNCMYSYTTYFLAVPYPQSSQRSQSLWPKKLF